MADSQKYKPLLHDNPLCGIDTYKDTLNLATGVCTRQIKKYTFTGEETVFSCVATTDGQNYCVAYRFIDFGMADIKDFDKMMEDIDYPIFISTHFKEKTNTNSDFNDIQPNQVGANTVSVASNRYIIFCVSGLTTAANYSAWFAQQYANGTPVEVYYILETTTTETITVPSGLSGTEEGYLTQSETPTPTNPIYPTANSVEIWQHSLRKLTTATDTFTTLPADIYADGNNATVGISGNTVQNGTPTPDNPIMPQGTGERTGNYLPAPVSATVESAGITIESTGDGTINVSGTRTSGNSPTINLKEAVTLNGTYYVHIRNNVAAPSSTIVLRNGTTSIVNVTLTSTNLITQITLSNVTIDNIQMYVTLNTSINAQMSISIEQTESVTPYEPFGYKIPISSAGTTTPVYLGEVESTRQIAKYVFTGEENFFTDGSALYNNTLYFGTRTTFNIFGSNRGSLNSHFYTAPKGNNPQELKYECSGFNPVQLYSNFYYMRINLDRIGSPSASGDAATTAFKTWLADQYAAGTPVTVWYVLATPTTDIVNEPLRKIGDYADAVSGITIPTITGADSFDVLTTLKPSEVSLSYTGWHDATVKEWDGSQWN